MYIFMAVFTEKKKLLEIFLTDEGGLSYTEVKGKREFLRLDL